MRFANIKMKSKAILLTLVLLSWMIILVRAQEEQLRLHLSRDMGLGLGVRIQGTFSFRVDTSADLARVVFFIDGEPVGEDREAPFRLQFRTSSYEPGVHTLSAVGYTVAGRELSSNVLTRDFLSGGNATRITLWIVIPILILALGGRALSSFIANRGRKKAGKPTIHGPLGGTICPQCGRPFAFHLWSLNLVIARVDRCPHCGKWSLLKRFPDGALETAADALEETSPSDSSLSPSEEDTFRRHLDDSRFTDTES